MKKSKTSSLELSFFIYIIISFRPAWLARALLSFKRAQSSGNDDVDEGQHIPSSMRGSKIHHVFPQTLTKSSVIRDESAPRGYSELQDLIFIRLQFPQPHSLI